MVAAAALDGAWRSPHARAGAASDLGSRNALAIDMYMEGQQAWETRTPTGLAQAQERFTRAIAADAHFARAYSGLARTLLLRREYAGLADAEAYPRAQAAARRALDMDPRLAEAHTVLGFVDFYWLWRPKEAEAEFTSAIRLDPDDVTTRIWYASMLKLQRRYEEGLAQIEVAQALAPESTQVLITKAMLELEGGQASAGAQLASTLEAAQPQQLWPHRLMAAVALREGRMDEYLVQRRAELRLLPDAAGAQVVAAAARGWASGGRQGMLNAQLEAQLGLHATRAADPYAIATTYALLGDDDAAIDWLHRAAAAHQSAVLGVLSDPVFARLRGERRMDDIRALVLGRPAHA